MILVAPKNAFQRARKALAKLEGLPIRGVTYGGPDRVHPTEPGPGWSTDAVEEGVDDGTDACGFVPNELLRWAGQTVTVGGQEVTLPTLQQLVSVVGDLPPALRTKMLARLSTTWPA